MKPRGFGSVYQPTYRNKNTGEIKKQPFGGYSIAGTGK
jgi:hypothetical protein